MDEKELQEIKEYCAEFVMKIVNKHHGQLKEQVAKYREEVELLEHRESRFENKILNALGNFDDKHQSLPNRLAEIQKLIIEHSIGVQRVYGEFTAIKKLMDTDHIKKLMEMLSKD